MLSGAGLPSLAEPRPKSPLRMPRPAAPRGLALVEVLICSFVCAMLLTATAVAFRASIMAYRDNTDRNILLSQGRIAMRQLISEIRQADVHGPVNDAALPNAITLFAQGRTTENGGIQILKNQPDSDDPGIVPGTASTYVLITWSFDPVHLQLDRTRSVGGGTAVTAVMASYVQSFQVRMEPGRSAANVANGNPNYDILTRAVVSMSMQNVDAAGKMQFSQGNGQVTERIIDAAVPRKNFSGS
jgi:Tfp pilus assembly protein PilW